MFHLLIPPLLICWALVLNCSLAKGLAPTEPVDVATLELTIPGDSSYSVWYRFAKGDEILLDFSVLKGKNLSAVKVVDEFGTMRLSRVDRKSIQNEVIKVEEEGCFRFELVNQDKKDRLVRFQIRRLPISPTQKDFNTGKKEVVVMETVYDTIMVDTLVWETEMVTVEEEYFKDTIIEENLFDKIERVHSITGVIELEDLQGWDFGSHITRRLIQVDLASSAPLGYDNFEWVGWTYWMGVGKEGQEAWRRNVEFASGAVIEGVSVNNPLMGIALGAVTTLILPSTGDQVIYRFFYHEKDALAFLENEEPRNDFDSGNGTGACAKGKPLPSPQVFLVLENDNYREAIDVVLKVYSFWRGKIKKVRRVEKPRQVQRRVQLKRVRPIQSTRIVYEICGE